MNSKLALGTVQFGIDYGINNTRGKVPIEEVKEILRLCANQGIKVLDTAVNYGDSEIVLGKALNGLENSFKIVSKLPDIDGISVVSTVNESINRLKMNPLYAYLFHSYKHFKKNSTAYDQLFALKNQGQIEKIGFSLYDPSEAEELLLNDIKFDLVQVPYNVFDRRFEKVFSLLKEKEVEIHTRSTFLQGLFFKPPELLPAHFKKIKEKLIALQRLFKVNNIPLASGLLCFSLLNDLIDCVVVGVDNLSNLKMNLQAVGSLKKVEKIIFEILEFEEKDPDIILPTNWKIK